MMVRSQYHGGMKQRPRSSGCGCLLFFIVLLIGAGIAIPKLTVKDPMPVSASLRACAAAGVAKEYDRPYEHVALLLGQSRVTMSSTSVAEVEPFTLFHLPLSLLRGKLNDKMSVDCQAAAKQDCDVGSLCLQHSQDGLFGVAQVQAYLIGKKSFDDPTNPKAKEACYQMRIVSTNDQRVIGELGSNDFVVSDETAKRYQSLTDPASAASLLIYLKERTGHDAGPCDQRVQILN